MILGAMGDSISRGYDIQALAQEDLPDNWSTGTDLPNSLLNELNTTFQPTGSFSGVNVAVVGDSVLGSNSTFAQQAAQLAAQTPQVVTVEIGANDVCQGNLATSGASTTFKNDVVTALQTLVNSPNPPKSIVVLSIPHIFNLTQIPALAANSVCPIAWNLLCPNLQVGQATFDAQWTEANLALQQAATMIGGPVIYDGGAVASTTFAAADVSSIDCFHPSVSGQEKIASAVWQVLETSLNVVF